MSDQPYAEGPAYSPPQQPYARPALPPPPGPIGKIRPTGTAILLYIVTLGFYALYWFYAVHKDMKEHSGNGLGGGVALILAIILSPVVAFLTGDEIGKFYEQIGREKPVSALTGLWFFPGSLIIVGPIIWFVKVSGAINDYWRSLGAPIP